MCDKEEGQRAVSFLPTRLVFWPLISEMPSQQPTLQVKNYR
jgi:hypothetical protein